MANQKHSPPAVFVRSETDLFAEDGMDVSLNSSGIFDYHPLSSLTDQNAPISFQVKGNDVHYLDLNSTLLYIRCNIMDTNGKPMGDRDTKKVAPVNNFLMSLFQQCSVYLNETQITSNTSLYAYRAYIETVLAYGGDYKDAQGRAQLYVRDSNAASVDDNSHIVRQMNTANGVTFDMIGRPHADIFAQTRYLIPGVDLRVTFHRSPDDFYIHSVTETPQLHYKCNIVEARLIVKKHTVLPSILTCHLKLWNQGHPVCYPMRKIELKTYSLPIGTVQNINENILNGLLPDRLIICLVESESMNGTVTTNPFDFTITELRQISVTANGEQLYHQSYQYDTTERRTMETFYNMYNGLGLSIYNDGPGITIEEFIAGKTFFVFNMRSINDGCCPPRHGNIKISIQLNRSTTRALNVICHADYQSTLYIDSGKNIFFKDYTRT